MVDILYNPRRTTRLLLYKKRHTSTHQRRESNRQSPTWTNTPFTTLTESSDTTSTFPFEKEKEGTILQLLEMAADRRRSFLPNQFFGRRFDPSHDWWWLYCCFVFEGEQKLGGRCPATKQTNNHQLRQVFFPHPSIFMVTGSLPAMTSNEDFFF